MKTRLLRRLALTTPAGAALLLLIVFGTGDAGLTQRLLNGIEVRALAGRSTWLDRLALRAGYRGMMLAGGLRYPQATEFLRYYVSGRGDTLRFDAQPLLRHPEVQQALRQHKRAITFRHQPPPQPTYHAVRRTDWDRYYAFDLLFIRQQPGRVEFYDRYFFQPLQRRSRTPFRVGKIRFQLNDGLIDVAYPEARRFVSYGQAPLARR